ALRHPSCLPLSPYTTLFRSVVSPYFLYQALRYKKYIGSVGQRLGYLPISFNVDGEQSIWIHAVSVGEALTARALAADLKARYPRSEEHTSELQSRFDLVCRL